MADQKVSQKAEQRERVRVESWGDQKVEHSETQSADLKVDHWERHSAEQWGSQLVAAKVLQKAE